MCVLANQFNPWKNIRSMSNDSKITKHYTSQMGEHKHSIRELCHQSEGFQRMCLSVHGIIRRANEHRLRLNDKLQHIPEYVMYSTDSVTQHPSLSVCGLHRTYPLSVY